jgi:hypothetical protein
LKHLGKVGMGLVSVGLFLGSSPASAIDSADLVSQAVGSEGGKEALNVALKVTRSNPTLLVSAIITCISYVLVASPGMCIACVILIAKTIG